MAHLYCNGGNRFNFVSIRNYTQNNFGGGYSYGCSMPSFGGIFSNWGTGIYNGCACNGGWNWSTFGGNALGSLVGSFLGMLCGGGNTSGSSQGQRATGNNGNGKDTDFAQIDSVHKKINNPDDDDVKDILKKCELNDCDKQILKQYIKGKLDTLDTLEKGFDGVNDTENKAYIDNLRNQLNKLATEKGITLTDDAITDITTGKPDGKDTDTETTHQEDAASAVTGAQDATQEANDAATSQKTQTNTKTRSLTEPTNINWNTLDNSMIPTKLTLQDGYIEPQGGDINDGCLIKVEDTSTETADIPVKTCLVSPAGEKTNGFPATIEITSSTTGTKWYYHYAGDRNGYPVYITPKTDINNNVYVLCKHNGEYKLMQFDKFSGYGIKDTQNDNK